VQQGTGVGQLTDLIKIGWSGAKIKITVDTTDFGNIALESWANGAFKPIGYVPAWTDITGKPATFPPSAHTHAISDVAGLSGALAAAAQNNATNVANITFTGVITGGSVIDNSDIRIKDRPEVMGFDDALRIVEDTVALRFFNTLSNRDEFGVIADHQRNVTPEIVFGGSTPDDLLGVAYSRMVVPAYVVLQRLIKNARERGEI
jgi:hypothetical protein